MLRKLLFLCLMIHTGAFAQDLTNLDFEAELRALENNQLKSEELMMKNIDAVVGVEDVISDEVATGQAAPLKINSDKAPEKNPSTSLRPRRIRSR